jgi:hypothetical protein
LAHAHTPLAQFEELVPFLATFKGLTTAFELAYGSGMLSEAADVLSDLTRVHALAGNDAEALRAGRSAIRLSKQLANSVREAEISISVAIDLLWTGNWKYAAPLMPAREDLACSDPANVADMTSYLGAVCALRSRNFSEAWTTASKDASRSKSPVWVVRSQLVAALAAHELGWRREAQSLIQASIPQAETLASAATLKQAYSVAARVTADTKFARKAKELTKLIVA